jgi:hypothetical protein
MDKTTLIISIAGLFSTALVSAIGIYFTHKSQRSPLREHLYTVQIDLLTQFASLTFKIQGVARHLKGYENLKEEERAEAREMWEELQLNLLEVTQRSSVVMPAALYSAMTAYRATTHDFKRSLSDKSDIDRAFYALMGSATQVGMLSRELAGADTLGSESVDLHNAAGYKKMQGIGRESFAKVSRALWTRSAVEPEDQK